MKLRNKKTGEIKSLSIYGIDLNIRDKDIPVYHSLKELNDDWEDAPEEPKGWCVTMYGGISRITKDDEILIPDLKEIGNYFNDKESAYDALDKLKAWKRLKDIGCRFVLDDSFAVKFVGPEVKKIVSAEEGRILCDDYRLLFGGEE